MTNNPTDADRAAAEAIHKLLCDYLSGECSHQGGGIELRRKFTAIIAEHMQPERERVVNLIKACRNAIAAQTDDVCFSCDVVISVLTPPPSETEEPEA